MRRKASQAAYETIHLPFLGLAQHRHRAKFGRSIPAMTPLDPIAHETVHSEWERYPCGCRILGGRVRFAQKGSKQATIDYHASTQYVAILHMLIEAAFHMLTMLMTIP